MQPTQQELAETYASKSEEELHSLHALGTLTDTAYEVLERELRSRGVDVPERPSPAVVEEQARREHENSTLAAHWQGKASLASAFWLVGKTGFLLMVGVLILIRMLIPMLVPVGAGLMVAFLIFAWVSIWRCWRNTQTPLWGYLARMLVAVYVLYAVMLTFEVITEG